MGVLCSKNGKKVKTKYILTKNDLLKLSNETNTPISEVEEYYEGFMIDCPNGYLSQNRLYSLFKRMYPNGNPKRLCRAIYKALDSDRDGHISFTEYFTVYGIFKADDIRAQLGVLFDIYDVDKNGMLLESEVASILRALYDIESNDKNPSNKIQKAAIKANSLMKLIKKSHSHMISKEEFIEFLIEDKENINDFLSPLQI